MNRNSGSFLPDDYIAQRAELRTNVISIALFVVVMFSVLLAFLVTHQNRSDVKSQQVLINTRYQKAASEIRELTELEEQKSETLNKAELAAALVERVPRSNLLAELINRMPDRLSLLEFELTSEKLKPVILRTESKDQRTGRLAPQRGKTREEAAESSKVQAPRYRVEVALVGVAPTDLEVSRYLAELNSSKLLRDVTLEYSEEKEVEGHTMRQFSITMRLDPEADMRDVDPVIVPRRLNPMGDELQIGPGGSRSSRTISTATSEEGD
jgi:Tfp pilus assembly protein PilN